MGNDNKDRDLRLKPFHVGNHQDHRYMINIEIHREEGIDVPEGVDVKFLENTEKVIHVVLPSPPPLDGELSDTELQPVAGGDTYIPLNGVYEQITQNWVKRAYSAE